jgi:hypothetical protein
MDMGELIGLIAVVATAGMLVMSYFGAYLLGRSRARAEIDIALRAREAERMADGATADRLIIVESAVSSMAQAIERLSEVERAILLQRFQSAEQRAPRVNSGVAKHDTPA